ncbi:MAG: hypothetical protein AB1512_19575 [Thermodesulfobacteriota bacterium]
MRRDLFKVVVVAGLLGSTVLGCQTLPPQKIQPGTLRLPAGSRVLLFEAVGGILGYDIKEFRRAVEIPGIVFVAPPLPTGTVFSLDHFVRDAVRATSVQMALIVSPITSIQQGYQPYTFVAGHRERTFRTRDPDGRTRYQTVLEPVMETRYRFHCSRTTYRVLQYAEDGELMGGTHIESTEFQPCPDSADEDVLYDDVEYVLAWLRSNMSAK